MKFSPALLASLLVFFLSPIALFGHATGESYVFIDVRENAIEGHFEVFFEDLDEKLRIEIKGEESSFQEQIEKTAPQIHAYIRENSHFGANGKVFDFNFTRQDKMDTGDQKWVAQYYFTIPLETVPDVLDVKYNMLYQNDPRHRGLLCLDYNHKTGEAYGEEYAVLIFSNKNTQHELNLLEPPEIIWGFKDMVIEGVWHIWIGIDHILFLIALLLPTVIVRSESGSKTASGFVETLWKIGKIVTVFTIAHSITLALAALDIISVSSRIVESIIALSIILVALNGIFGKFKDGSLLAILILGLFHGMGFASVMGDLPFRMVSLTECLIGFNVGVELGQLAIVLAVFPILFLLRKQSFYFPVILVGGSLILIVIAGIWFVERAFAL